MDSNNSEAFFLRAIVYRKLENFDKALEDINKALEIDPDFGSAYNHRAFIHKNLKNFNEALNDLKKFLNLVPEAKAPYLINSGNVYATAKQYKEALKKFDAALKLSLDENDQENVYANKVRIYRILHQFPKALKLCNKLIKNYPKSSLGYTERAIIHHMTDLKDEASKDFDKAISLNPDEPFIRYNQGIFFRKNGLLNEALEIFKSLSKLKMKRGKILGFLQLSNTYAQLGKSDKALDELDNVLAIDSNYAHAYTHKGLIHGNLLEFEESIRFFTKAIKLDPNELGAYLNRAIAYSCQGLFDSALSDFENVIKLDPNQSYAYFGKGKSLCYLLKTEIPYDQKKKAENLALKSLRKALNLTQDTEEKKLIKWWINFSKKYFDASKENRKRLKIFAEIYETTLEKGFFSKVIREQDRLSRFMSMTKTYDDNDCFLQILRRWNSYTPVIPGKFRSNLGGGYFFVCDGKGTIIDPGYNFIENFIEYGFSLGDIDNVVLTHAHDDHTADFEPLLSLFSQLFKSTDKKIKLYTNLGASVKFSNIISKNERLFDKIVIMNTNTTNKITPCLELIATPAEHNDVVTNRTSKGLIFKFKKGSKKWRLGITGDTKVFMKVDGEKGIFSCFENVDALILHIGSIHESELQLMKDNFEGHNYNGEHLGIRGIVNLIFKCRPKLAIISEFGEELKELRTGIAYQLDNTFENYNSTGIVRVIPSDIGLKIVFKSSIKIECEICKKLVKLKDIKYCDVLINNKIAFHCKKHDRKDVIEKFKKREEKELLIRAKSMGCSTTLTFERSF